VGWWLLRASGTEAKLTIRCEATDDSALAGLREVLESQLALSGVLMTPQRPATRPSAAASA
jgi:phosphomannomutase